jgi:predicted aminopeptidase
MKAAHVAIMPAEQTSHRPGGLLAKAAPLLLLLVLTGCQQVQFYSQAVRGQLDVLARRQSIDGLLANSNTPPELRARLELLNELREFARTRLHLPVDGHYQAYADLHRPFVVWNVEAAPEFSLQAKSWRYPLVGSLEYRGYFHRADATNYARALHRAGYDVVVGGVQAYSTLGWFKDPALNTFLFEPEEELAELLFHELAHQRVFAGGDKDFDEAFATAVGQEGARRWLKARGKERVLAGYEAGLKRTREFAALVKETRLRLAALYGDTVDAEGRMKSSPGTKTDGNRMRAEKQRLLEEMRRRYGVLKASWGGASEYDGWFQQELNNAQLNSVDAYYELVPAFERLIELNGGELGRLYGAADTLRRMHKNYRHVWLNKMR